MNLSEFADYTSTIKKDLGILKCSVIRFLDITQYGYNKKLRQHTEVGNIIDPEFVSEISYIISEISKVTEMIEKIESF